jgi:Rrf2 family transcriptional regulator, nitric oxide-sensitive transcriptional repressor
VPTEGPVSSRNWSVLSRTGEYAIRAVAYLADSEAGANVTVAEMADALKVPRNYLSKIMHALVHSGVVEGTRGPRGGFRLARSPDDLTLLETLDPFEMSRTRVCMLGRPACDSSGDDCPGRIRCGILSAEIDDFFRTTCIGRLVCDAEAR